MAWYPGAVKMELQPESDQQHAIKPDQFIVHSIIAPWTAKRTYEYWRDSTNLESHFGLGYEGDLGQFIGTETRADANYLANRRPDGHGAVSIETASNTSGTDPWTPAQIEELIKLGVWLHEKHGIPLRICPEWDAPGYGYHRLHSEWAKDGTSCPGDARVRQFKEVVFPGIVARATGKTPTPEEDDVPISDADVERIALAVAAFKNPNLDPRDVFQIQRDASAYAKQAAAQTKTLAATGLTDAQLDKLADKVADKLAARLAN
ncbi:N-acetylmuramoyl-L-alanine amidase [Streptomyces sp. NPDC058758]|uniref:peptidoglycan recognition protein family protein n=1 Tax=Streptomyces sp. NPDC058758 TaxID=3346627 RepID=UPI0036A1DE00